MTSPAASDCNQTGSPVGPGDVAGGFYRREARGHQRAREAAIRSVDSVEVRISPPADNLQTPVWTVEAIERASLRGWLVSLPEPRGSVLAPPTRWAARRAIYALRRLEVVACAVPLAERRGERRRRRRTLMQSYLDETARGRGGLSHRAQWRRARLRGGGRRGRRRWEQRAAGSEQRAHDDAKSGRTAPDCRSAAARATCAAVCRTRTSLR